MTRAALGLFVLVVAVRATAAAADTIVGDDDTRASGTVSGLGKTQTFAQHRDLPWTGTVRAGKVDVTVGTVVDEKLEDGKPAGAGPSTTYRDDVLRSLAYEAKLVDAIGGKTFAQDVPVALTADELRAFTDAKAQISARLVIITWAGTAGDVAHYRVYAVFALGGAVVSGQVAMAGTIDLAVGRHALVDARMNAVLATTGLARFDAKASAHLTRRYR